MCRIFSRTRRVPAAYPLTRSLRTRCVPAAYSPRTCFVYTRHLHQMASVSFAAGLRQVWPRHPPGHLPAKPPGNLQGTFGKPSGHFRGTLGTPSGNLPRTFWKPSGTLRCLLVRVGDGRQWDGIVLTVVVIAPRGDGRGRHTEAVDCLFFRYDVWEEDSQEDTCCCLLLGERVRRSRPT